MSYIAKRQKENERYSFALMDRDNAASPLLNIGAIAGPITIDGQTVNPSWEYIGDNADVSAGTWATSYGVVLNPSAGTDNLMTGVNGPNLDGTKGSLTSNTANGKCWTAAAGGTNKQGAGDIVWVFVIKTPSIFINLHSFLINRTVTATPQGYQFRWSSAGALNHLMYADPPTVITGGGGVFTPSTYYLIHICLTRSVGGSVQYHANQALSGIAGSTAALIGTFDNSSIFRIQGLGSNITDDTIIYYAACYERAAWLVSSNNLSWHQEQYRLLRGIVPSISKGTSVPVTDSCASNKIISVISSNQKPPTMFLVGNNWIVGERIKDKAGNIQEGLRLRPEATNLIIQSNVFNAGWIFLRGSCTNTPVINNSLGTPTTFNVFAEDGNTNTHNCYLNQTVQEGYDYCFSLQVSKILRGKICLTLFFGSTNYRQFFDLDKVAIGVPSSYSGTAGSGPGIHKELDSNWRQIWFYVNIPGSSTIAVSAIILSCDDSYGLTYTGLSQNNYHIYGAQLERGRYPTSLIPTSGAAATRLADQLIYKADDGNVGNQEGVLESTIWVPSYPVNGCILSLNDSTANNEIKVSMTDANKIAASFSVSGVPQVLTSTSSYYPGQQLNVQLKYRDGEQVLLINESVQASATLANASIPTGITRIQPGYCAAGSYFNHHISDIRIAPRWF